MEESKVSFKVLENLFDLKELADAYQIRDIVFIQEQSVPIEHERDDYDIKATHIVMYYDDKPIGNARFFYKEEEKKWYVGRIAIIKEYRGKSFGKRLMEELMITATAKRGVSALYMHSQVQVIPFYEKLGWIKFGEKFSEAGIDHFNMYIKLHHN